MELEYLFQHSGPFMVMQLMMGSLLVPAAMGRVDLYRAFVRNMASYVVSFGPVALLVYVLFEVSRLS
ncbi:MAG: hypothetical protein AABZ15_12120 [Nitrospirota bacterium]